MTQNLSLPFADRSRVNLELSGFELTLELAAGQDFEAVDYVYVTHQLPFDLEVAGGDMGIDLGVCSYY